MLVRWNTTTSTQFTVANGVKQSGIISPILFNMYMDDLSETLHSSGIGGYLGDAFLNHLCYADELYMSYIYVLLACPPVECSNC